MILYGPSVYISPPVMFSTDVPALLVAAVLACTMPKTERVPYASTRPPLILTVEPAI